MTKQYHTKSNNIHFKIYINSYTINWKRKYTECGHKWLVSNNI